MNELITTVQPLLVVSIPLATTLFLIVFARIPWLRQACALLGNLATLGTVLAMWPLVSQGKVIVYEIPLLVSPLSLTFRVDGLGLLVAAAAAFVWLAATIYALSYMSHELNQVRFYIFLSLTFAGTMGVPMSGDFLSLLVFFEIMTLASYVLVIHTQTEEAIRAGNLYLYMGVFGGLCLVGGIGLLYYYTQTLAIIPSMSALEHFEPYHLAAIVLLIVGFGIKAGMVPLHIWLPRAHPVAPAPASALLSGVMIKIGVYGIIRTVNMFFTPAAIERGALVEAADHFAGLWHSLADVGLVLIWIGIVTMLFGAFMALLQDNIKKMLACSSISQMGFIILGVGTGAYLGYEGAMGLSGAFYHILNHALFKSLLFLAAGVFAFQLGELNMSNLGGLWRRMPFTTVATLVGSLGIVGIPLFNGYASKTLLHHALVEAYEHHHLASLGVAEWLFTLASAGTACYFLKFLYLTLFRKPQQEYKALRGEPWPMKIGMAMLSAGVIIIGIFPNLILGRLITPVLDSFMLDPHFIEYHLGHISFWTFKDISAVALALLIGVTLFGLGMRTGAFKMSMPRWLSLEYTGSLIGRAFIVFWGYLTLFMAALLHFIKVILSRLFRGTFGFLQGLDYRPGRSKVYRTINFSNIDFDVALVMIIFGAILIALFYLQFGLRVITG
ncbi:MAG: proton-conducting transporter membrane subunit [Bacillota bacterium]